MTPETWKKIGRIVERALAYAAHDREQYLHQVYEEAPELRAEIEAMLAAYEENSDEKLSRFGGAIQWIQTTRLGRSRTIFGATIGLEPGAGWLLHANLTWPLYVGSFQ